MGRPIGAALIAGALLGAPAFAQTGGTPVETAPVQLSAEKQAIVREHVKAAKVPETRTDAPILVGEVVPESTELWGLPQDMATEVPAVTNYRFLLTGNAIAVVDPETRKVVQLISRQ